jgi:hypothetical protein
MADIYLAGIPDGGTASNGEDIAPAQSPALVPSLLLVAGSALEIRTTGGVYNAPSDERNPPDGAQIVSHDVGAENGISTVVAPINSLVGVFLGPERPDGTPPPLPIDFSAQTARDYLSLRPLLKQVFFIGDGMTSDGKPQRVIPPAGATRLFLGTMDGGGWYNNVGEFSATITVTNALPALRIEVAYVSICWLSSPNVWYQVEYRASDDPSNWAPLGGPLLGTGQDICIHEPVSGRVSRIYRLVEVP